MGCSQEQVLSTGFISRLYGRGLALICAGVVEQKHAVRVGPEEAKEKLQRGCTRAIINLPTTHPPSHGGSSSSKYVGREGVQMAARYCTRVSP